MAMTDKIEEIREKFERLTSRIALVSEEMRRQSDRADKAWAEVDKLREALTSIARNTCCDRCQEAALVAREALKRNL